MLASMMELKRLARWGGLACAALLGSTPARPDSVDVVPPPPPAADCTAGLRLGALDCEDVLAGAPVRDLFVDLESLGIEGLPGGVWLSYDLDEVTRPLSAAELADEGELSLAVRLILSEVGADRMLSNRYGLYEAIGILYTVDNRLDATVYNPEDQPRAPVFEGCGADGSFYTCANADQYLGMATWRALDPGSRYRPALLEAATDLAVTAWWLQERGLVADFTEGATNYTHRCGATAYGLTTHHCDRHMGRPRRDVRGANPHTGPLVFRAPEVFRARAGLYSLYQSRWIDYEPWWAETPVGAEELPDTEASAGVPVRAGAADIVADLGIFEDAALVGHLRGMRPPNG